MRTTGYRLLLSFFLSLLMLGPQLAQGTSYLPLSDRDLARRAPVIVRAQVLSREERLEIEGGQDLACTLTTFQVLEVLKGKMSLETFRVELPGGQIEGAWTSFPGTPEFLEGDEVVLFLAPTKWHAADHALTELGLSHFEIVEDASHRRFAVRRAFELEEDDFLSQRAAPATVASAGAVKTLRDAESFLTSIRSLARGATRAIEYAAPRGEIRSASRRPRPLWVNIGGTENGNNPLFRWFWDTGRSPNGTVTVSGAQSNLSDGSNGASHVQNAVNTWRSIANSDVRYSYVGSGGNVIVNLDVDNQGTAWTTPLACGTGGVVGFGGPGSSPSAGTFKGDAPFYAIPSGTVWMRHLTGSPGCYPASNFEAGVLHELGHTLGLGHPDQSASTHSSPCPFSTCTAVMRSTLTGATTPQPDDLAAILWYYGTGGPAAPTANFTAPATAAAGTPVSFVDTSTGGPISWSWAFGDGVTSTQQNPSHTYATAGIYNVTLTVSNANGSGSITKSIAVSSPSGCAPDSQTLCLNASRFRVRVAWSVPSQGTSGVGQAVALTSDTGYFWFFSSSNVELVIKVLDGRPVNGRFWVFYGALSDVQYTITVTDTATGSVKTYSNPQGNLASVADVSAFSSAVAPALPETSRSQSAREDALDPERVSWEATLAYASFLSETQSALPRDPAPADAREAACAGTATALCLNQSRFTVGVAWSVPSQGTSGVGQAVPLTSDTGYFWFFSSSNVELVIKVLDGRPVNGRFWVFYGALSDVQYTITVTDTTTGTVKTYANPQGNLASVADVSAF